MEISKSWPHQDSLNEYSIALKLIEQPHKDVETCQNVTPCDFIENQSFNLVTIKMNLLL